MVIESLLLCRHGFRLSWETSIWNAPTGTPRDPPLSAHGVDQAVELATWLASLPDPPEVIYSSPLYRCLQTATPTAERLGIPIHVEHGVSEWYLPVKRGLHPRSLPAERLTEWFPLISTTHSSLLYPTQRGESIEQVHTRAADVLRLLIAKLDAEGVKHAVIFTHAATNIAMARALMGNRESVRSGTCSVGKYVRKGEGREGLGEWERVLDGECGFLEKGEERHWEFEYVEEYEEDGILDDATEEVPLASEHYTAPSPTSPTPPPGKL